MTLRAGARLGPYEVQDLLGAGGMGEVYRARDPRLGREVAVKVLPSDVASDSARLSLFEREAHAVAALNHPNILTVHDVGSHEGTPYVVTELLEGETLRELVSRRAPTVQQILAYMLQAARGLEAAHAKGIVHRDLKPENLFLTTDGRVKVLDFGLAKLVRTQEEITSDISTAAHSTPAGQVAGTVLYMSPEQARAQAIDVRSDVFSFGIVLYELLAGTHPFRKDTVAGTLTAIVEETPQDLASLGRGIPPAVGGIVRRCLEKNRDDRYASGHDVAMVLEAVLAAPSGAAALREVEERSPYPGLSSFTEKDSAVFFGREREIEELWKRIPHRKLLAVIGPSGAGKTSFVRAGVLPARPEGWSALVCTPGAHPFRALGQALGPELAGDTEALGKLAGFDDPDTAVELLGRWKGRDGEALLVVDQFEELVTLNPREVQERFVTLLRRLWSELDVHVVLSLRDDFLIRCVEHEPLAPVLEGLSALLALKPEDLRRAIEEPAKKQGYRFEDEGLVDEMVESVEGARAALPLLAFAVSRLWEKRDREKKVLTRTAYEAVGGVAGALAQHAEQTMDRIGTDRQGMVREIFRNLVTSQGTRAVANREELLSVFPERDVAQKVLGQLIDARLLTSYEVQDPASHSEREVSGDRAKNLSVGTPSHHRIEIVHESLLKAWPRLVRWQAQDEEGAVLRDQLKQAAHVWEEKNRSPDVLWSGTALREYELWRERYAGKLTVVEERFASAMVDRDRRRRRWRRAAVAALVVGLATVAVVVSLSRQEAVQQARLAEAAEIVALGRTELEKYPTAALAYARKSLEVADTAAGRQLAATVLWQAPPARILPLGGDETFRGAFSPDGTRFAVYTFSQSVKLYGEEGTLVDSIGGVAQLTGPPFIGFTPSGDALVTTDNFRREIRVTSIPGGHELVHVDMSSLGVPHAQGIEVTPVSDGMLLAFREPDVPRSQGLKRIVKWPYANGEPERLGGFRGMVGSVDAAHSRLAVVRPERVVIRPLQGEPDVGERTLGGLPEKNPNSWFPSFSPDGRWLGMGLGSGSLLLWSTPETESVSPARELRLDDPEVMFPVAFDREGSQLVWGSSAQRSAFLWDLEGPPDAEPLSLPRSDAAMTKQGVFHPREPWVAVVNMNTITFWAYDQPRRYALRGHKGITPGLGFTPDARFLVSCGEDGGYVWPLDLQAGAAKRWFRARGWCYGDHLPVMPDGSAFLNCYMGAVLQPLDGSDPRVVYPGQGGDEVQAGCAIDKSGRLAAVTVDIAASPEGKVLRLFDLDSGQMLRSWPLVPEAESGDGSGWSAESVLFRGTEVLVGGSGGLRWFDTQSGGTGWIRRIHPERAVRFGMSRDGRRLLIVEGKRGLLIGREGSEVTQLDADESERAIRSHGRTVNCAALDPSGEIMVTGDMDGVVRVGSVDGSPPHLLLGHTRAVNKVEISPDGQWVASKAGPEILLWKMPDLSRPPLHTLPYDELMAKLESFTNLEVVEDEASSTGYRIDIGPFPGWRDVPTW